MDEILWCFPAAEGLGQDHATWLWEASGATQSRGTYAVGATEGMFDGYGMTSEGFTDQATILAGK